MNPLLHKRQAKGLRGLETQDQGKLEKPSPHENHSLMHDVN